MCAGNIDLESVKREILLGGRGRRTFSEQEPNPNLPPVTPHLWGHSGGRKSPWCKKRTSAPQFQTQNSFTLMKAVVLRSRGSWPAAPLAVRR
ncbi:UNVERIFIED_CONTAM: hypothetical protein PYX00_005021 [Menopon gallinae]|uniref:Uncharacterized protein n=1 Tax=Menopon gallinae TaxID=328185 RepID=A0AAW2I7R8_9NEOP